MIRNGLWIVVAVIGCGAYGCNSPKRDTVPMPYGLMGRPVTLVVAPVHDLTGTAQLDALAFTDILASELTQIRQISVVPVNQTLAVMYGQGWRSVGSPQQALQLARLLNADGVVVTAVSEYDPYDPPRLGIVAEIYLLPVQPAEIGLVGEEVGRSPTPPASRPTLGAEGPVRQVQRIFEAARKDEQESIRQYAALRDPPGKHDWSEYMRSQKQFLRYCCWRTVLELLSTTADVGNGQG